MRSKSFTIQKNLSENTNRNRYIIPSGVGETDTTFFFFDKALDKETNVLYNSKLVNNVFTLQLNTN